MIYSWIGAVTASGFTASVKVSGPVNTRLAVSTASDMSSPSYSATTTGADGWHKLTITGLSADTLYYWAIEEGGVLGSAEGAIRTFPTEGATRSFSVAAASCCQTGRNPNTFTRIKDRAPAIFLHTGDFHYADIATNDTALYESAIEGQLALSNHDALYRDVPIAYMWDDHDYATNNSDGSATGRPAALTTYRKLVPHYPISFTGADNDTPISQTWVYGRVRFVQLDVRSEADFSPGDPALNSLIGTTQLNWLTNLIETFTEELMVIDVSVPWVIGVGLKVDTWGNATTERTAISDAIQTHANGRVLIIHGDSHMVAMDDGTNSNYATTPVGPGPRVCCFAPLDNSTSIKGGPYSEGTYVASDTQYGMLEFFDSGTAITVTATGYDAVADTELVSMVWKVGDGPASDKIIYWAADVTAADALPADTAAYVETDGANPTRVRLNGEWWNIDSIAKDGVAHTLDSVYAVPTDSGVLSAAQASVSGVGSVTPSEVSYITSGVPYASAGGFGANQTASFDSGLIGSYRALVVLVAYENGGNPGITAINYGGIALTKQITQTVSPGDNFSETVEVWTAPAPPTGVNTLTFTNSSTSQDAAVLAAVYASVDQTTLVGGTNGVSRAISTDSTFTISKPAGDMVVWGTVQDRNTSVFTAATDNTKRQEQGLGDSLSGLLFACGDRSAGSGTVTVGATRGEAQDTAAAGVVLQLASVPSVIGGSGHLNASLATVDGLGTVTAGQTVIAGNGDMVAQAAGLSGVAERVVTGAGALSAEQATVAGFAVPTITGTGTLAAGAATLTVSAELARKGTATLQAALAALSGTGQVTSAGVTGTGALAAQEAAVAGAGARTITAAPDLAAQQAALAGTGIRVFTGTGTLSAQQAALAGTGTRAFTGTGALAAQEAAVVGAGVTTPSIRYATGALAAAPASLNAQILRTVKGSGTMIANQATVHAYPWVELHVADAAWTERNPSSSAWTDANTPGATWEEQ